MRNLASFQKNIQFIILFLFILSSCKSKEKEPTFITVKFDNTLNNEKIDSIYFPDDGTQRIFTKLDMNPIIRRERQKIEIALKIPSLENGFPGQHIRIRGNEYDYKERQSNMWDRLLVFSNEKNNQCAEVFYIRYAGDDGFILIVDSLQYQKHSLGTPKSGWNAFFDSLNSFGIFLLPNYDKIQGYNVGEVTHDIAYEIELGKTDYYRIYSLPEIREGNTKFSEVKKFQKILEYIKKEFDLPAPLQSK